MKPIKLIVIAALLAFAPGHGLESVHAIADLLGRSFGWDAQRRAAELKDYEQWLSHLAVPGRSGIGVVRTDTGAIA